MYESPAGLSFVAGDVDGRDEWVSAVGLGLGQSQITGKSFRPTTAALEGGQWLGRRLPMPPRRLPGICSCVLSRCNANCSL